LKTFNGRKEHVADDKYGTLKAIIRTETLHVKVIQKLEVNILLSIPMMQNKHST
jgi:hypothetical protein